LAISRRKFLFSAAALGILGLGTDTVLLEPNLPRLNRVTVTLSRLPEAFDGYTIAQLSDFHYDDIFSIHPIRKAVEMVHELNPDLVVLTGDFVTISALVEYVHNEKQSADAAEPCARILGDLRPRDGIVGCLGNHDVKADAPHIIEAFDAHGIGLLRNKSLALERSASRLWLACLDSISEGKPDLQQTLRGIPKNETVIALVHEPDYADILRRHPVDLQLSGHTHGGQIRIPLVRPLYLPEWGQKYTAGLYHLGGLTLYTNVGIGTIRLPVRWNCPPEVTLLTLRRRQT
jgi:uncharacterized protein